MRHLQLQRALLFRREPFSALALVPLFDSDVASGLDDLLFLGHTRLREQPAASFEGLALVRSLEGERASPALDAPRVGRAGRLPLEQARSCTHVRTAR
jgi:hypothetical protein